MVCGSIMPQGLPLPWTLLPRLCGQQVQLPHTPRSRGPPQAALPGAAGALSGEGPRRLLLMSARPPSTEAGPQPPGAPSGRQAVKQPTGLCYLLYLQPACGRKPFRKLENRFQASSLQIKTTCWSRKGRGWCCACGRARPERGLCALGDSCPSPSPLCAEAGLPGLASKPMCARTLVTP